MRRNGDEGSSAIGFLVLPSYLSAAEANVAIAELPSMFPTADEFHDYLDPAATHCFASQFGGITNFPFDSVELSLLAVHSDLIDLAEEFLASRDLRVYSIEAWAKYTRAASYEQPHHRDYLNHSLLVPNLYPPGPGRDVPLPVRRTPGTRPAELRPTRHTRLTSRIPELATTHRRRPGRYDLNLWIGHPLEGATYLPR